MVCPICGSSLVGLRIQDRLLFQCEGRPNDHVFEPAPGIAAGDAGKMVLLPDGLPSPLRSGRDPT